MSTGPLTPENLCIKLVLAGRITENDHLDLSVAELVSLEGFMLKEPLTQLMATAVLLVSSILAIADEVPVSGLYRITSGSYSQCCGLAGTLAFALPDVDQAYIVLSVAPGGALASMTLVGEDQQTVLKAFAMPPRQEFAFSFSGGVISTNSIHFSALTPAPLPAAYDYLITFSTNGLVIHGLATLPCQFCSDVPTQFGHSNVVAAFVSPATQIETVGLDGELLSFQFSGEAGYDYFVEFSPILPAANWLSLTNFRAKLGPVRPLVVDSVTNAPARFYRIRKVDCFCD